MDKKKKDRKSSSIISQELNESNELLRMEDQNHSSIGLAAEKNATISSFSHENTPSLNQQIQQVVQWPHITQSPMEHSPLISNPSLPNQHHQQPNPNIYQVQHGPPPMQLAQPFMPFLRAYQLSGVNAPPASYQPIGPVGTTDISWQGHSITGGEIPRFCYHGYPYLGFPGPWDPTSWWGQAQQSIPPFVYNLPGACGSILSLPPPMPSCSATTGQILQRGLIHPPEKLSHKHQKLWEAQSAENLQLWALIGQLQTELADYKSRLLKLEAEVFSQKPIVEKPTALGSGTSLTGQSSKRGRPKKPVPTADNLPTLGESRPRARGQKPAMSCVQSETKEKSFRYKRLKKVEQKENPRESTDQNPDGGNIAIISAKGYRGMCTSGANPLFCSQIHRDVPADKNGDSIAFFDIVTDVEGVELNGAPANIVGRTSKENFRWNSNTRTVDCVRDLRNSNSQGCYDDTNVIGEGRDVVVRWSFGNEKIASVGFQKPPTVGCAKDEDDEMEDDYDSSETEDMA